MNCIYINQVNSQSMFYKMLIYIQAIVQKASLFFTTQNNDTSDNDLTVGLSNQRVEKILDLYGNSILRLAYSYLHNKYDAEEVLQDTVIKYLQAAPQFKSREHEKAWLLRVAANISKNKINYNKIRETDELKEDLVSEYNEDLTFVWDAVKELPEKYREVIHLYYHEGYSTAQIASILKKNQSTIRSYLKRGREKLQSILKEAYDFE